MFSDSVDNLAQLKIAYLIGLGRIISFTRKKKERLFYICLLDFVYLLIAMFRLVKSTLPQADKC